MPGNQQPQYLSGGSNTHRPVLGRAGSAPGCTHVQGDTTRLSRDPEHPLLMANGGGSGGLSRPYNNWGPGPSSPAKAQGPFPCAQMGASAPASRPPIPPALSVPSEAVSCPLPRSRLTAPPRDAALFLNNSPPRGSPQQTAPRCSLKAAPGASGSCRTNRALPDPPAIEDAPNLPQLYGRPLAGILALAS